MYMEILTEKIRLVMAERGAEELRRQVQEVKRQALEAELQREELKRQLE